MITKTNTDMRGTDSAALATSLTTAQADLDIITGADGVVTAVGVTVLNYLKRPFEVEDSDYQDACRDERWNETMKQEASQ